MNAWGIRNQIRNRVGQEVGVLRKAASFRVALCSPAPYAAAMSSLGYQTIYREIHLHEGASAERAFLPDIPGDYRKSRMPVVTYESETPLSEFSVVAFSIAYELEITGVLEMLDLSGIPLLRRDRTEKHPIVIAGGPLTNSNAAILGPFIDLILVGEGEGWIHTFLTAAAGMERNRLLERFSSMPGCWVPEMTAEPPQQIRASEEMLPAFSQILTANAVLTSMFLIEPERGCSRGCSYCVMRRSAGGGMRVVPAEKVLSLIPANARRVGLVGAAVTDHPEIKSLVQRIVESGREIGLSSLRADRLDEELVEWLAKGGYKSLTTAADGASQRMRDLVGRKISEQHLIRAAEWVRTFGLRKLKLYAMVGLPGEAMSDIDELVRFSKELCGIAPLSLSISPFVPKRSTPLAGAEFEPVSVQTEKISRIRHGLKGKAVIKPASPRWAWVEYMLSQGGESEALAAMDAWSKGNGFAAWKRAFIRREAEMTAST